MKSSPLLPPAQDDFYPHCDIMERISTDSSNFHYSCLFLKFSNLFFNYSLFCRFNTTLSGSFYDRLREYVGSGLLISGYQIRLPMTPADREVRKFCLILKRRGLLFDVRQDPRGYSVQVLRYV